jgi:hypothetical protein
MYQSKTLRLICILIMQGLAFNVFGDPYADDYNKNKLANHKAQQDILLKNITNLYFAVGCEVFPNQFSVIPLINIMCTSLADEDVANGIPLELITNTMQTREAAKKGMDRAAKPKACDYWHQHPEKVYELRQAADSAMRAENYR